MFDTTSIFILFLSSVFIQSSQSTCIASADQCGCSVIEPRFSQSKIVGGYTARSNSWPWMVSLRRIRTSDPPTSVGSSFCGGALINEKFVLTAAHCTASITSSQLSRHFVVLGAQYRNDSNPLRYSIRSVIVHSRFNSETYENDISLLELSQSVDLSNFKIRLICLPPNDTTTYPDEPMTAIAIGWGRLKQGGISSNTLQQVELPIISYNNSFCANVVVNNSIQFCAGFIEGGKDTCQGDSGGPLMIYDSVSDTWNIAGITSYGYGCAAQEYPGVYTRVSMYIKWINARINGNYDPLSSLSIKTTPNGFYIFLFYINYFLKE